jgi:L-ascorbate metabolism protein UlaG (beta-lactamase superfamily)
MNKPGKVDEKKFIHRFSAALADPATMSSLATMPPLFPVSDHCDGRRFFNPAGASQGQPFTALPRWWWQRLVLGEGSWWPKVVEPPLRPQLPAEVETGRVAATFIGHATWLLQFRGLTVLTDPFFSDRASPWQFAGPKRARPPALQLDELPAIDFVLLSHCHYDHLDLPALRWLARERRPLLVTTLGNRAWLAARGVGSAVELDWWQAHAAGAARFTCVPALHFAARWPWDRNHTLWGGFVLTHGRRSVYFCGDSAYGAHFRAIREKLSAPDLALLPIGAYEPRWFMRAVHMNPAEAVQAHRDLGTRRSLGMHHGTIQLTNEAIDAPLHDLAAARAAAGVSESEFAAPRHGSTVMS